jgi:DNA polymerase I-like protein with 3'-5' exonuclease and polymerase domains
LEFLGGDGKLYVDFLTARARHSILKTWIENTDDAGNLHGDCMAIGTPSMRARHSIIVNVPAVDSPWGKEMRSLFTCKPGWKLIGCDSSGNQARGLAHYLGDKKFIDTLLHGDIHQYNADKLTEVVYKLDAQDQLQINPKTGKREVLRPQAKRILYAFLFGASGPKLWSYIFGVLDEKKGPKLKNGFLKAVPGFKALIKKLGNIYGKTSQYGDGYIPSLAGNRIYVDSYHKLLVYLLQSAEKITCSAALMLTMERLEQAGIPYIPCIFMHDEIDFQVPEEFAEQARAIGKQAFVDGPKLFGVEIMDGEGKIGNSWYEVH